MLKISEPYKTILVDELALIREKMHSETDIRKKVYYFSAVYAMIQRIFNIDPEFDRQLIFMYSVLAVSYNQIRDRINQIIAGDRMINLPEDFFEKIDNYLHELENKIRIGEDTYITLEKIAVLTYTMDGNGHYLVQKGRLELPL